MSMAAAAALLNFAAQAHMCTDAAGHVLDHTGRSCAQTPDQAFARPPGFPSGRPVVPPPALVIVPFDGGGSEIFLQQPLLPAPPGRPGFTTGRSGPFTTPGFSNSPEPSTIMIFRPPGVQHRR